MLVESECLCLGGLHFSSLFVSRKKKKNSKTKPRLCLRNRVASFGWCITFCCCCCCYKVILFKSKRFECMQRNKETKSMFNEDFLTVYPLFLALLSSSHIRFARFSHSLHYPFLSILSSLVLPKNRRSESSHVAINKQNKKSKKKNMCGINAHSCQQIQVSYVARTHTRKSRITLN